MAEPDLPGSRKGRVHDARAAREAILNAAEKVFAEHGFDGARVDAIAAESGYNKSLLFQYFGDKLGLYVEIVKRADGEMTDMQRELLTPLLGNDFVVSDAHAFKAFLETMVTVVFDYLVGHPSFMRMLLWEQAEGWQTYSRILSAFTTEDSEPLEAVLQKAYSNGLLRSNFVPLIQLTLVLQICLSYLSFIPLYQMVILPGEELASVAGLARAREYIVNFVVAGMMVRKEDEERK